MREQLKLLGIFAHPDDETLGPGGTLAKYAAEGVQTYLLSATRGERSWAGKPEANPGLQALGAMREAELRCAAKALCVKEVVLLDYMDGELDKADPQEIIAKIALHLRRIRPQVIITFDPLGVYGHPDHIAIAQFTLAAIVAAASPSLAADGNLIPHTVSKLYFIAETQPLLDVLHSMMDRDALSKDGMDREPNPWPSWAISAQIDTSSHWDQVMLAIGCHQTQLPDAGNYASLVQRFNKSVWSQRTYYRAFSQVNGGREKETDLFDGLRESI